MQTRLPEQDSNLRPSVTAQGYSVERHPLYRYRSTGFVCGQPGRDRKNRPQSRNAFAIVVVAVTLALLLAVASLALAQPVTAEPTPARDPGPWFLLFFAGGVTLAATVGYVFGWVHRNAALRWMARHGRAR
ncbi:MAG: hypothetical protein H0X64_15855 [Gemmatimonadaceae bacterium]|nr:hypothetical protein [Gemmatimonadaceae bacterium]